MYYIVSEVAQLLGVTTNQVTQMCRNGELKGYKHTRKWLILKNQPAFEGLELEDDVVTITAPIDTPIQSKAEDSTKENSTELAEYVCDAEHYTEVFLRMKDVKKSLRITTCNLKNFVVYVPNTKENNTKTNFAKFILSLCKKGIKVQIACMKPLWFYYYIHNNLPDLEGNPNFELKQDNHMHMKVFIFDDEVAYIGSGNLTGAALGLRSKGNRNHEAGVLVKGNGMFQGAKEHFDLVWRDEDVKPYGYDMFCRELKELKAKNIKLSDL